MLLCIYAAQNLKTKYLNYTADCIQNGSILSFIIYGMKSTLMMGNGILLTLVEETRNLEMITRTNL